RTAGDVDSRALHRCYVLIHHIQTTRFGGFFYCPEKNMIYNAGTISFSGNTVTGSGTSFTSPSSQIRIGQTLLIASNPVQLVQITAINSATSLTVTPAASPAVSDQRYGIFVSDSLSVDGLAQSISQLINEYDENIGAWETFAT